MYRVIIIDISNELSTIYDDVLLEKTEAEKYVSYYPMDKYASIILKEDYGI